MDLIFSSVGSLLAPTTMKNVSVPRCNNWPLFSSATMVFSKVGGCGLAVIAWTSLSWSAMPASIAGW